ncbi:50S ribosomal protein L11 methyltransferase [Desulfosudis oleivorans]|uniref:Ribosomal L11 methyltransferase n=1 Tax=Desulfosudis oleivorans (strain DSM 6200 / JCM 39069 / Hxd3) TaxID=96561 RepID=A8ZSK4_DESOH|nr:50S ribosomal protein L11 methyltransferase [Desulfosudis oleivorans]ABW65917.1 ribosomal L11 methyltransferase [Desulfosudis oleivorans Hxd3]
MKTSDPDPIAADVVRMVTDAEARLVCRQVIRAVSEQHGVGIRRVKAAITGLVDAGTLRFSEECGNCFLEKNYGGTVRLSPHVMVAPPRVPVPLEIGCQMVRLMPGAAFGDCRHPTTRLSVCGLDFLFTAHTGLDRSAAALDIGTGSGVLALVAARLGVFRVLAIDIDPCARKEAADNVALNDLSDRIVVSDRGLEQVSGPFFLVTANLRLPTLKRYAPLIDNLLMPGGGLVVSGIRTQETAPLMAAFDTTATCIWQSSDGGWSAMVFIKHPSKANKHQRTVLDSQKRGDT